MPERLKGRVQTKRDTLALRKKNVVQKKPNNQPRKWRLAVKEAKANPGL
jgi:hypothetical protein